MNPTPSKRTRSRITRSGQISIPAEVRRRWDAREVTVTDEGDRIVVTPVPKDLIARLQGAFANRTGKSAGQLNREYRQEDIEAEEAKWRRYYGQTEDPPENER